MSFEGTVSTVSGSLNLENIEAKHNKLAHAVRRLLNEARAGSSEALVHANVLLEAGLQTILRPSYFCGFQVAESSLGTQVSFTIPKGLSGKLVIELVEKVRPRTSASVIWENSELLKDPGLESLVGEDTRYTFIVCTSSDNRNRSQHDDYLAENGLDSVPRWILTVGAALFRDKKGFPISRSDMRAKLDDVDLFKGKIVRASCGAVVSYDGRLLAYESNDEDASADVVVAGTYLANQKS